VTRPRQGDWRNKEHGLQFDDLTGSRFQRLARIKSLMESDRLDADLRWRG
jgi:hypothetical protein